MAEVVVFVALGLTVDLGSLDGRLVWLDGILLAALLAFVARPLVVGPLLAACAAPSSASASSSSGAV